MYEKIEEKLDKIIELIKSSSRKEYEITFDSGYYGPSEEIASEIISSLNSQDKRKHLAIE